MFGDEGLALLQHEGNPPALPGGHQRISKHLGTSLT
jgi:hypothetical protein